MKRAFTLIEVLIVLLLMSIVYGIYFFTMSKSTKEKKFSLIKVKEYLKSQNKSYGDRLTIICGESKTCYLLNAKKKILKKIELQQKVKTFLLKQNEILEPTQYKNIALSDSIYFKPTLIYRQLSSTQFETLIYYTENNKWVYISPYFNDTKKFINKEELISYIKKRAYLPMYAGVAK